MTTFVTKTGEYLLTADDNSHRVVVHDERPDDDDRDAEDEQLARCVADAVCDAIKSFRKGDNRLSRDEELERREKALDDREEAYRRSADEKRARGGRDALADPQDHRRDFRSGDGRSRDGKSRAADSKRGIAQDRDTRALANADAIWPSSRPYRNDAPADVDVNTIWN